MNKKFFIAVSVLAATVASLALSACGNGGTPSAPPATLPPVLTPAAPPATLPPVLTPTAPPATLPPVLTPAIAPAAQTYVQGKPIAQFYTERCSLCHGAKREGVIGPALIPARLTATDDFYVNTIKNGRPGTAMASFPDLSAIDIQLLVNFIKYTEPQ